MLTAKEQKFISGWKESRKSKRKFCIINGSIIWGITTSILVALFEIIIDNPPIEMNILIRVLIQLIFFMIGGYFWGLFVFRICEKRYLKLLKIEEEKAG